MFSEELPDSAGLPFIAYAAPSEAPDGLKIVFITTADCVPMTEDARVPPTRANCALAVAYVPARSSRAAGAPPIPMSPLLLICPLSGSVVAPVSVAPSRVGPVPNTSAPDPVSPVTAAARLALLGPARNAATFAPRPPISLIVGLAQLPPARRNLLAAASPA